MAEVIVGPLLSKLQEVVLKEAKALAAVGGDIDKLRDKFLWLQALVHEADLRGRHDGSRLVQVLAFQIRDAGFEVEDAVDQFYLQGNLRRRLRDNWWRVTKEFILNLRTHILVQVILSRRIRSINVRLEEIIGNKSTYTLSQSGGGDGKSWRASRAIPPMREEWDRDYSEEFVLKYRRRDAETLMHKIIPKGNDVSRVITENDVSKVITVVGVEGVGKTALLMHVYKQESIKKEFNVRIWLSFPPDISEDSMIQQIKQDFVRGRKMVEAPLEESRCLVVIDSSVRTTTGHKVGNQILTMVGKGSRIVLSVASSWHQEIIKQGTIIQGTIKPDDSKEGTHCTFKIGAMDEDHSLKLFHHIYDLGESKSKGTKYQVTEVNHIGSNIMEITNGLPLAVVLVAKLMRTMDFGKWKAAADYLKCNSEDNKLRTILSVCVDDLSDELKSCLLYTAGFPEMRPIDAHQLVRLWMAEGFLTQKHKLEMEELGQCYLKELIYRGLFQLIRKSSAHGGYVQWVAIPDQIHPLLRLEAQRTSFMDVHYGKYLPPPRNTRRLALHSYNNTFPALDNHLDKLRTVVSYSDDYTDYPYGPKQNKDNSSKNDPQHGPKQDKEDHSSEPEPKLRIRKFLRGSPYLRVINLEGIKVVKQKKKGPVCALPHGIGEMVHLRYLGVRCWELKKVPSSIGNLRNLQTIDVRGTCVRKLPEPLWKVKTLRHVLGNELAFPRSSTATGDDLKLMHTLESVTIDGHPDIAAQQMQHKRGSTIGWQRGQERLRFLHRLHVANLGAYHGKALASVLKDINSLEALILSGDHIPMDWFAKASKATPAEASEATAAEASKATAPEASAEATAAEAASEAIAPEASAEATASEASKATTSCLKHVEFLMLDGQLHLQEEKSDKQLLVDYKFLRSCLENLTHLVLRSTKIGQEFIHEIGKLLSLAELELLEGSYKDDELIFRNDEFNSLTLLRISCLDTDTVKKISVPDGTTWRNMDINIDVPDNVTISKPKHNPQGQQPGGTAGNDQQAEGSQDQPGAGGTAGSEQQAGDTPGSNNTEPCGAPPPTKEDGNSPLPEKTLTEVPPGRNGTQGSAPTMTHGGNHPDKTLTEIILEAVNNNNSSKSTIIKYIKDIYVDIYLCYMVNKSHELTSKIDRGNNVYHVNGDKKGTVNKETGGKLTKIILEAVISGNSSKTTIVNYVKDKYMDTCLDSMVKSRTLISQKNGRYTKYYLNLASQVGAEGTVEDNAGPSSTEPPQQS